MKLPLNKLSKKKAWLIASSVMLGMLVALGYVLYSLHAWQDYEQRYSTQQATTKSELNKALSLPMTSLKERQQKLVKLEAVSTTAKKLQTKVCDAHSLTGWQSYFKGVKTAQDDCQKTMSAMNALTRELDTLTAYLQSEHKLATLLAPLTIQPAQPDEKTWDQVAATWKQLDATVVATKVNSSFEPTKKVAITAVKGVDGAWQELLAAHAAKDKTRFVKARTDLTAAYLRLESINDENETQLTALAAKFDRTYKTAF